MKGLSSDKSWYRYLMGRKRQANVHIGLRVLWWTTELGWVNPRRTRKKGKGTKK